MKLSLLSGLVVNLAHDAEISSFLIAERAKRRRKAHKERQIRKFIPADNFDRRRMQKHET